MFDYSINFELKSKANFRPKYGHNCMEYFHIFNTWRQPQCKNEYGKRSELGWDQWDFRDTIDGLLATANNDYLDYYNDPNIDPNATPINVPFVPFF